MATFKEAAKWVKTIGVMSPVVSHKNETFKFRRGYFYTGGYDEQKYADACVASFARAPFRVEVVSATNHWHAWPKDSYWEVIIKVVG